MDRRTFLRHSATGVTVLTAAVTALTACSTDDVPEPARSSTPPDVDSTVWRQWGTPLEPALGTGVLSGQSVAVKDLFAIRGRRVGAGNEAFLGQAQPEHSTARAVQLLQNAGAALAGIARTDEFAYSLAGTNGHYGTPPNPQNPDRIPGGSSSGSAAAVALGQAQIGLGTDTGGSIRIPASYQGLYGIRTTHGVVPVDGLIPLAQSFDTVGWLTRSPDVLARTAQVLVPQADASFDGAVFAPSGLAAVDRDVADALDSAVARWRSTAALPLLADLPWDQAAMPAVVQAFQTRQGFEAWRNHGQWVSAHWDSLNADVRSRFQKASTYSPASLAAADGALGRFRAFADSVLGNRVLVLPSASSREPLRSAAGLGGPEIEKARASTFQLTCIAGATGRPAISVPLSAAPGIGLSIVGPRNSDLALVRLAEDLRRAGLSS